MSELHTFSVAQLAAGLKNKDFSSTELTQHFLNRIAQHDKAINSFITVTPEQALAQAAAADKLLAEGKGADLTGVPLAHKDIFCTQGVLTTCGSKMLENFVAPYNATIVENCQNAGLVMLGKTSMDEFAMGSSTENSAYQVTRNPWDTSRVPGGSGGGSAAALAAFQAPLAIGTDTGGSIRQPAALTSTVGVKPTYGTVSRFGLIACASSLDQGGPCARTVLDTALLHQVIAGHDPRDSTSVDVPVPDVVAAARAGASGDLKGVRVGVVKQLRGDGYQPGVLESFNTAVDQLTELGAEVIEVDCPHFDHAMAAYYLILPSEVSSNLARFDAMRFGLRVGDVQQIEDVDQQRGDQTAEHRGQYRAQSDRDGAQNVVEKGRRNLTQQILDVEAESTADVDPGDGALVGGDEFLQGVVGGLAGTPADIRQAARRSERADPGGQVDRLLHHPQVVLLGSRNRCRRCRTDRHRRCGRGRRGDHRDPFRALHCPMPAAHVRRASPAESWQELSTG